MISQIRNVFAFERDSLSKSINPFLSTACDKGVLSRPGWNGSLAKAGIRTSAIIAILALGVVWPAIGQATPSSLTEPAQASPASERDQVESNSNSFEEAVNAPPADPDREAWHEAILNTPRPQEACSTASYPEQQWHEISCDVPPDRPVSLHQGVRPDIVGGFGSDLVFVVANGIIAEGEGSFDKVTGVTSEKGGGTSNSFSLQLNTNPFTTKSCGSHKGCQGWVQFVYDSFGHHAFIQYWMLNYGNSCLAGWTSDGDGDGGCFRNSHAVSIPGVTIAELQKMKLYGYLGGYFGNPGDDLVTLQIGDNFYTEASGDPIQGAVDSWTQMEFNVFGDGNGSQAVFNTGTTIQVRDSMTLGTANNFGCTGYGTTAESNSLTVSATSPLVVAAGPPSLVFIESNVKGTKQGSCANAVVLGEPHHIPFPAIADKP